MEYDQQNHCSVISQNDVTSIGSNETDLGYHSKHFLFSKKEVKWNCFFGTILTLPTVQMTH
jgi:hypothetical protein